MVLQFGLLNTDTCRGMPLLPSEPREEFLYMLETVLVVWTLLVMVLYSTTAFCYRELSWNVSSHTLFSCVSDHWRETVARVTSMGFIKGTS